MAGNMQEEGGRYPEMQMENAMLICNVHNEVGRYTGEDSRQRQAMATGRQVGGTEKAEADLIHPGGMIWGPR